MVEAMRAIAAHVLIFHASSLEKQLRKIVQIISPYRPCVAARIFMVGMFYFQGPHPVHHDLAVFVGNVFLSTLRYPEFLLP
jgi:hypothetical protein